MKRLLKRRVLNNICFALCMIVFLSAIPTTVMCAKVDDSKSDRIIVSMGDSYSSGEGIDDFYDYNLPFAERIKSEDWLAHRSQNSWGGQLRLPNVDGTMAENRNTNWFFVASSGAETVHITGEQYKYYHKEEGRFYETKTVYTNGDELSEDGKTILTDEAKIMSRPWKIPAQYNIFDQLSSKGKQADYVTITIGGNDVGFSNIITKAATPGIKGLNIEKLNGSSYLNPNAFSDLVDMLLKHITSDDITNKLIDTYGKIQSKSGAKIIVAGYPKLLEQSGKGILFNKYESETINNAVHVFNLKINSSIL